MDVYRTFICPFSRTAAKYGHGLKFRWANWVDLFCCPRRTVGMKLTDCHKVKAIREQCGTSSLELMVRTRAFIGWGMYCEWMSIACRGRVTEIMKPFPGMYSSAFRGCHEEGSGGGTTFLDFLKLACRTKLIPWPEVRAAAEKHALDRQT
eukprot:365195-Chlamydomonas_euryale.AAC.5